MSAFDDYKSYRDDGVGDTAAAILVLADNVESVSRAIRLLGNADAATPMGAIEAFGKLFQETMERGLSGLESLSEIATNLTDEIHVVVHKKETKL